VETSTDPLVGRRIGQYAIVARLGGGGMGVVYKARDERLGRPVALKFLPQQWSDDETAKQRFVREAQAASATDHPNICTIHDIGSADDGRLFIVMAYYEGQTLKQRLESGPLPVDDALDIATQVAEGLAKAHAQRVIHRDIKPANLILTDDGVRIVDFGLAKFADTVQLTVVGSTLGTAAYMSPEQVKGEETDARSDVWALGVVLYEMLAGHPPFRGSYVEAISYAIRTDAPAPLRAVRPEVPEDVEQVVFRALHKDPAVRFESGRDFARALRQARGLTVPLDLRTQAVPVPLSATLRAPRRWPRLAGAALALALVAGAAAWWFMPPADRLRVLVMPVSNQTGFGYLDDYQSALSYALLQELADSPNIRVLPWPRMLQSLHGLRRDRQALSGPEARAALTAGGSAPTVIQATLLWEAQRWQVRVEITDGVTGVRQGSYLSDAVASALPKDTVYRLVADAAHLIETHFDTRRVGGGFTTTPPDARPRGLDPVRALERGVAAAEDQEYAAALGAFEEAAMLDPQSAIAHAWISRVARVMRRDDQAGEAGRRAVSLLTASTNGIERGFIEAVAAEARGDVASARVRLADLRDDYPDEPGWAYELAALAERNAQGRVDWERAIAEYHEVLRLDGGLIRPQLELCRLYNRLADTGNARKRGELALGAYTGVRWSAGEALARLCLVDALRAGSADDVQRAHQHAEQAMTLLEQGKMEYNIPRGLYYLGLAAGVSGRLTDAVAFGERALKAAAAVGNEVLRPVVFNNLGVAQERLGNGAKAAEYYQESARLYERLGDQRGAAVQQFNSAALRIQHGEAVDEAPRDVENALAVVESLGEVSFEITSREQLGHHLRFTGRYADADRELTKARALAEQNGLPQRVASATLALAMLRFDQSDYPASRTLLQEFGSQRAGYLGGVARVLEARIDTKLGRFTAARESLRAMAADLERSDNRQLDAYLQSSLGVLEFEARDYAQARLHFERAAARLTPTYTDSSAVEARAYLGLLDAMAGRAASGSAAVQQAVDWARSKRRVWLETSCRLLMARLHLLGNQPRAALDALDGIAADDPASLGTELRLMVNYWRGRALSASGGQGAADTARARTLLDQMRSALPADDQAAFSARPDVRDVEQAER
jgi:tRNA A-37 threonylcarbamoyl transferase component Bud32/tetratricopeptide (TPR) repeat protein